MKILFIPCAPSYDAEKHVVSHLWEHGHTVVVEPRGFISRAFSWKRMKDPKLVDMHRHAEYDFVLMSVHPKPVLPLVDIVAPKYGTVYYDHDLLQADSIPTTMGGKPVIAVTFHRRRETLMKGHTCIPAKWFKLSMPIIDRKLACLLDVDSTRDAVMPYTELGRYPPIPKAFRRVYTKRFWPRMSPFQEYNLRKEDPQPGLYTLPPQFDGPAGGPICARFFRYFLATRSSLLLEALLHGSLPVVFSPRSTTSGPHVVQAHSTLNALITMVYIPALARFGPMPVITTDDLEHKLEQLSVPSTYAGTHRRLYDHWFADYSRRPAFEDAVLTAMETLSRGKA